MNQNWTNPLREKAEEEIRRWQAWQAVAKVILNPSEMNFQELER